MKNTVIGAGAIGGGIGAYLCRNGEKVQFVDINEEYVKAMREKWLSISQKEGSFTTSVEAYTVEELLKKWQGKKNETGVLRWLATDNRIPIY